MSLDRKRLGRCYELAGKFIVDCHEDDAVLVHGRLWCPPDIQGRHRQIDHAWVEVEKGTIIQGRHRQIDHAWVEVEKGTMIWEPVQNNWYCRTHFYCLFRARAFSRYARPEALGMMIATKRFGPWSRGAEGYVAKRSCHDGIIVVLDTKHSGRRVKGGRWLVKHEPSGKAIAVATRREALAAMKAMAE